MKSRPSQPDALRGGTAVCGRLRVGPSTKVRTEGTVFQPSGLRSLEVGPVAQETEGLRATGVKGEESLGNLTP